MLQEEKSAKLDSKGFMSAGKGRFVTAIAVKPDAKTFKANSKKEPQKLPQVWECKKGRPATVDCETVGECPTFEERLDAIGDAAMARALGGDLGGKSVKPVTSGRHYLVTHRKEPAQFITPTVWKDCRKGDATPPGKYDKRPGDWFDTYIDPELAPEKCERTWWLYKGVIYSTEEKLKPADVAALADEKENRKRLTLEKAHALQAMRQQADGTKDWKPGREPIPQEVKQRVWQRDGGSCVECGSQKELEFDHVIPLAMGGSNTERNLQLLCADCNRRKGATLG